MPTVYLFTKDDSTDYEKEFKKAANIYFETHSNPETDIRILWLKSKTKNDAF